MNQHFLNIKNGSQYPGIEKILDLAQKLQVSPFYFLGLSSYPTLAPDEINRILGLSEKAMKILFMLNHNVGECNDLTDNVSVSLQHKGKLNIFNSFIEDNVNFLNFLTRLEQYIKLKEKQLQDGNEDIESQLSRIKRRHYPYIVRIFR